MERSSYIHHEGWRSPLILMACFFPVDAWKPRDPDRKRIVFNANDGLPGSQFKIPCGQCSGCREDYSLHWSNRLIIESRYHECSSFITTTYDTPHLPKGGTLELRDVQLFMKRVRKFFSGIYPDLRISFFAAGEYGDHPPDGERFGRPHYHFILFGVNFHEDRKPIGKNKRGDQRYMSETLTRLWGKGLCDIGDVTPASCKYVAGYIQKKLNGNRGFDHYNEVDETTGEITRTWRKEFATMSRRPAIGLRHYQQHGSADFNRGAIIIEGKKAAIPKYFDRKLKEDDPIRLESIKTGRFEDSQRPEILWNNTPERLAVRCESLKRRRQMFNRRDL